ncbi:MAG: hypothetical protein ACI83D_000166 [Planctomycetota bacterium]|jgi:hypothetical protein
MRAIITFVLLMSSLYASAQLLMTVSKHGNYYFDVGAVMGVEEYAQEKIGLRLYGTSLGYSIAFGHRIGQSPIFLFVNGDIGGMTFKIIKYRLSEKSFDLYFSAGGGIAYEFSDGFQFRVVYRISCLAISDRAVHERLQIEYDTVMKKSIVGYGMRLETRFGTYVLDLGVLGDMSIRIGASFTF